MSNNKILLVDDEPNVRETIKELLEFKNYDVRTATNGQEALDLLEYWTPDLIICDIVMPVMDGNELHNIVKDNQLLSSIPFIFLSAKNEDDLMRKCLLEGADDFLTKPFKINELMMVVISKLERFEKIKSAHINLYIGKKKTFLHEINTPLNGILGIAELLLEREEEFDKTEIYELYQSIKVSGERLNRTLKNIILYQNLQHNLLQFDTTSKTNLTNVFKNVKEKLCKNHNEFQKRIRYKIEPALIAIDELYLDFILFELIDNAIKFSPKSKKISVIGHQYNKGFYEIEIRDFGIGFSAEELKKIGASKQFNRDLKNQQGLGLGLFLSKSLIKKTNGVFSIMSKQNEGTCIKIYFPLIFEPIVV